jgi:hypothetical protein
MPPALRHTAGCPSGQRERSVKPSAQPTLVRTQHLPLPAETARLLRILARAGRFFSVPACVTLERCRSSYCAVHGRIADGRPCCRDGRYAQLRRSVCTVAAVGAHRRLFHGRPRTGRADRIFPGLGERRSRACTLCGHPAVRAHSRASRPNETGDRRQCSPRHNPGPAASSPNHEDFQDRRHERRRYQAAAGARTPLHGSYHGTWLTPSARQYRIHPERRFSVGGFGFSQLNGATQNSQFCCMRYGWSLAGFVLGVKLLCCWSVRPVVLRVLRVWGSGGGGGLRMGCGQ